MAKDKITEKDLLEADGIISEVDKVEKKFLSLLATMKSVVDEAGKFRSQQGGNDVLNNRLKVEEETNAVIKERLRVENALIRQKARNSQARSATAKALQDERTQTNLLNRENREESILKSKIAGAYKKLNLERTRASRTLRDLIASEKASNAEIAKAQAEFDKLDKKVRAADGAVRDSTKNVGNYKSALSNIKDVTRQLVSAFGLIEGVRFAAGFIKDSIEIANRARGVEFAFRRLGDAGVESFTKVRRATRGMLSDLDIKTALVDFDNFNLSLAETDTLFEFLAVRSVQTGKSIDKLQESLVEGLSKESKLRIDNLGISTAELNAELEKTPSFIQAVANIAKREVAEAGDILDEAADNAARWSAETENLKSNIGALLSDLPGLGIAAGVAGSLARQFQQINFALNEQEGLLNKIQVLFRSSYISGQAQNQLLIDEAEKRKQVALATQLQREEYVRLNGTLAPLAEDAEEKFKSLQTSFEAPVRDVAFLTGEISRLNEELEGVSTREEAKYIQDSIKSLEKEKEAILGVEKTKKDLEIVIQGTVAAYEKEIEKQEKFIRTQAKTTQEIKDAEFAITQLKGQIEELREGTAKVLKIKVSVSPLGAVNTGIDEDNAGKYAENILGNLEKNGLDLSGPLEELKAFNEARKNGEKAYTEYLKAQKDAQAEIVHGVFREFQDMYGVDATAFSNLFDSKKNDIGDFANAAIELNNLIYNISAERYAADYQNAKAALDATLDDETKSEEQKAAAKAKFRKEEAKIKKKEFEADKKAALLNIAISTAVSLIKLWASPGFPAAIPLSILVGGIGIAQAAIVASKKPPKFFKGKKATDGFEGWATWGEKRKEVSISPEGAVEVSPNRTTDRYVRKGEIIEPSIATFKKNLFDPSSETYKRLIGRRHMERVMFKTARNTTDLGARREIKALRRDIGRYHQALMAKDFSTKNVTKILQY